MAETAVVRHLGGRFRSQGRGAIEECVAESLETLYGRMDRLRVPEAALKLLESAVVRKLLHRQRQRILLRGLARRPSRGAIDDGARRERETLEYDEEWVIFLATLTSADREACLRLLDPGARLKTLSEELGLSLSTLRRRRNAFQTRYLAWFRDRERGRER